MKRYIHINEADNVAVVLADDVVAGERIGAVTIKAPVARGHKVALKDIAKGEPVVKYGFPIGHATADIAEGEWVHSHNLATSLGDNLTYQYTPDPLILRLYNPDAKDYMTFQGYLRKDGRAGIRNELWVVPTVGCVNGQANAIVDMLKRESGQWTCDDIKAWTHNYGCSQLGEDHANTRAALAALVRHPNAGGVLVLGLGCENNQLDKMREVIGEYDPDRVKFLVAQDVADEVEEGVKLCHELLSSMSNDHRETLPLSKLTIGLKCGGSDGLSGITANPLVGMLSDRLVKVGASTVLTEVPEMFGAETLLMNRAVTPEVFDLTVSLINDFKGYFRAYGQPVYENPSPGNKAGGITTLEEKSLGCVQKGGTAPVVDVLRYTSPVKRQGLSLLNAPGNDLVASTALALSGCQMVLFTTGRGTPFGTFVPTMKIATNSALAAHKSGWIDFDAGRAVDEDASWQALTDELLTKVISTASGSPLKHELTGAREIAIFKTGVTL